MCDDAAGRCVGLKVLEELEIALLVDLVVTKPIELANTGRKGMMDAIACYQMPSRQGRIVWTVSI